MNTKQQIVAYSADMLRTRGFNGFSYLDISRELGITKASVHHHFPKKQDLGLALCVWANEWLVEGFEYFEANGTSEWDKLQRYGRGASKHCLSEQMMCPISALHSDLNRLPLEMQQALKVLDNTELAWVGGVLQAGIDGGEFTLTDDPRGLASVFVYSCKGALYYDRLHGKELFQQTMQQFERLIKA